MIRLLQIKQRMTHLKLMEIAQICKIVQMAKLMTLL
jgi:hypothetical protein